MSTPNTHHGAAAIGEMLKKAEGGRIFFCGIGGINMSSLAELTLMDGFSVAGSDRAESDATRRLRRLGCDIYLTHDTENVNGADLFVYTVAISPYNPEYLWAGELGIPRISRADYLGYIMTRRKNRIGISGTHGKSTCTAMCNAIFSASGEDSVVMCGAEMIDETDVGCSCVIGKGDSFIFEACEYMDSFLDFNPTVAVILNVELDHVDYFDSIERMRDSFGRFAAITMENGIGCAVYNRDCAQTVKALEDFKGRRIPFGIGEGPGMSALALTEYRGRYSFDVSLDGNFFTHVELSVPGRHNVYNALAALSAGYTQGLSPAAMSRGLLGFKGTRRRMEYKGSIEGVDIYDDYAHHPTEIEASLTAARRFSFGRLICIFQSHTYSRTAVLLGDMANALSLADTVLVAPIYSARETDDLGVSQYVLADEVARVFKDKNMGNIALGCGDFDECIFKLLSMIQRGDTVIVMGAGDIYKIFDKLELEK